MSYLDTVAVGMGVPVSTGEGAVSLLEKHFDFASQSGDFYSAFWALFFTVQLHVKSSALGLKKLLCHVHGEPKTLSLLYCCTNTTNYPILLFIPLHIIGQN